MNRLIISAVFAAASALGFTQTIPAEPTQQQVVRRVKIKHADPLLIAHLLNGNKNFLLPPEISTVLKTKLGR